MWKINSRQTVYQIGPCTLDEVSVEDPNGTTRKRVLLSVGGNTALIIPRLPNGNYLLCKQSRIGFPDLLEFPNGSIEPGETEEQAATRELHEELGAVGELRHIGSFTPLAGLVELNVTVFVATDVTWSEKGHTPESYEKITPVELSPKELSTLISEGSVVDGYVLAALQLERA